MGGEMELSSGSRSFFFGMEDGGMHWVGEMDNMWGVGGLFAFLFQNQKGTHVLLRARDRGGLLIGAREIFSCF